MFFSLLTYDRNYVVFKEGLALLDRLAKIRKRITFWRQPLDNKFFLRYYTFKFVFIANNALI